MNGSECQKYICIFAKPPLPGKTKRRLAKEVGDEKATEISKSMLYDIVSEANKIERCETILFYPPGTNLCSYQCLIEFPVYFVAQEGEDLGERMGNAFEQLISLLQADKVIVVGSDCITHDALFFDEVFQLLDDNGLVIQPADDGGYTLIAQSKLERRIFNNIEWGSSKVIEQTKEIIEASKINCYFTDESFDVDVKDDLKKVSGALARRPHAKTYKLLKKDNLIPN